MARPGFEQRLRDREQQQKVPQKEVERLDKKLSATLERAFGKPGAAGDRERYEARERGGSGR